MNRFGCLLISLALVSLVVIAAVKVWDAVGPLNYPRVFLQRQPSPDGSWIAFVGEDHFSPGFGGDSLEDVVGLAPSGHPGQTINLLVIDTAGDEKERPRIVWSDSTTLRVTVSHLIDLYVLTLHAQGVEVDLHLDPDDPPAMTAWLREKGLVSGVAGGVTTR